MKILPRNHMNCEGQLGELHVGNAAQTDIAMMYIDEGQGRASIEAKVKRGADRPNRAPGMRPEQSLILIMCMLHPCNYKPMFFRISDYQPPIFRRCSPCACPTFCEALGPKEIFFLSVSINRFSSFTSQHNITQHADTRRHWRVRTYNVST